ncbi:MULTISPECIES: DUF2851 family protein [unclassified Olleya]|jgi:hypothetical protein|uniref:DUF2851 family protein n=1 Tax=unclassified Olleya TaxID=2615019 RepID=UPI0011A7A00D|nr:DUF2851 family protein [Olleya sp. Hel_I_94]TVZ47256.1 uncharacterized protein DUF2851 [Olleya sp. Hel_I_94]
MQEDFLHYLWKLKKFETLNLQTTKGEQVVIQNVGTHNYHTGPDFFNAQLIIAGQLWAGNVEIHSKSSDWYVHNHEVDPNYDNVILHVVWEHDTPVFRKDNSEIPTIQLKNYVSQVALNNYAKLFNSKQTWINCENTITNVTPFVVTNWLERLFFERLESKAKAIEAILKTSNNNWEAVLFKLLAKNFGLKVNDDAFFSLANSFDFSVVRKQQSNLQSLEALFFGQAGLLDQDIQEAYYIALQKDYAFLKQKFKIDNASVSPFQFFRLRPPNFPTIRLSQLANVYHLHQNVFSKVIASDSVADIYKLFSVSTSPFWESHYTFDKVSSTRKKQITKSFVDLLLINTIIPLKFCYAKQQGKSIEEEIVSLMQQLKPEKNGIVDKFASLKVVSGSALDSQAVIQLKNLYCDTNRCLKCAIGNTILAQN